MSNKNESAAADNPFDDSQKEGVRTTKWCVWEVLKGHQDGLALTEITRSILERELRTFGKRPDNQVSGDLSRDKNHFSHLASGKWRLRIYDAVEIKASPPPQLAAAAPERSAAPAEPDKQGSKQRKQRPLPQAQQQQKQHPYTIMLRSLHPIQKPANP
ncbi:hypothetical protein WJX73_001448 [Symbiochloris irregularis]|uniref:HTH HARE-type domain-containing protein n=1 Tax=Symbiochloris irregularis TaxID=706552 RepID=A0AAW1NY03_9CHLO